MFARSRRSLVAVLCAIALLLAACGGSDSTSVAATDNTPEPASSSGSSDAPSTTESPIGDLLGIPFGDDDAANQYFEDLGRQAEIRIAECMIAQGFEYQVVDYSQLGGALGTVNFESREFAEQYGFGIASNPFEESFEAFESFEDPNQTYLQGLSAGEQEAYQLALRGELPDFDATDSSSMDTSTFEPAGCQGQAFSDLFAFGQVFDEFGNELEAIEDAYNADPRIIDASSGWAACMTEAGYRFADVEGAEDDVRRRYDAIVSDPDAFVSLDEQMPDPEDRPEGAFVFGPQTLNPQFQAQVDELAVEERVIALASWDCNEPLRQIEDEVRIEYEQRFVDENGDAIRAALDD